MAGLGEVDFLRAPPLEAATCHDVGGGLTLILGSMLHHGLGESLKDLNSQPTWWVGGSSPFVSPMGKPCQKTRFTTLD